MGTVLLVGRMSASAALGPKNPPHDSSLCWVLVQLVSKESG